MNVIFINHITRYPVRRKEIRFNPTAVRHKSIDRNQISGITWTIWSLTSLSGMEWREKCEQRCERYRVKVYYILKNFHSWFEVEIRDWGENESSQKRRDCVSVDSTAKKASYRIFYTLFRRAKATLSLYICDDVKFKALEHCWPSKVHTNRTYNSIGRRTWRKKIV